MMPIRSMHMAMALFLVVLVAMTASVYSQLPATVPMHWNYKGEADGFGSRATVWLTPGLGFGMVLLFVGLSYAITKVEKERMAVLWMGVSVLAFFTVLQALVLSSSLGYKPDFLRWMASAMSLMFMGLGRSMRDLPRNGMAGIRTPWTMASDEAWRISHQRASKIVVWFGAAGLLLSLAGGGFVGIIVAVGGLLYTLVDSYRATRPSRMKAEYSKQRRDPGQF